MSAPGEEHEARVGLLDACAVLSGHLAPGRLADKEIPDVVRVDPLRLRLFVGDAKDTETPGCAATSARLQSYARAIRPWLDRGFIVRLALCHGRPDQAAGWATLLDHAARRAGLAAGLASSDDLEPGTVLTWLDAKPPTAATRKITAEVLDDVGAGR